jgi:hypothetical protein
VHTHSDERDVKLTPPPPLLQEVLTQNAKACITEIISYKLNAEITATDIPLFWDVML